jgi:Na+/citrate or Na+/malate symporter
MTWEWMVIICVVVVSAVALAAWIGWLIHLAPVVEEEDQTKE